MYSDHPPERPVDDPVPRVERLQRWLALLLLLSVGFVWPPLFASPAASLDQVRSGSLLLKSAPDATPAWALRQSTRIRARVTGNVARVHVEQRFTNPGDEWVEGFYAFPLSTTAAVDALEMQVGERRVRGQIQRKEQARATYEQARSEGRQASLVDQHRPNLFTTAVANIAPRSTIIIEIAYLDTIAPRDGRYTLALPLAITPRYTPGVALDPAGPLNLIGAEIASEQLGIAATPEQVSAAAQSVEIEVDLASGSPLGSLDSLHHVVTRRDSRDGARVVLRGDAVAADRDFELVWTAAAADETQAAAFSERVGEQTFALVMLEPPQMTARRPLRRELLFIIDTSGSMEGTSIEQARAALQLGIDRLGPDDRFNVIRFSDDASALFEGMRPATPAARRQAAAFVGALRANGGTEMRAALELAFSMPGDPEVLRQVVFITDGSVGNEAELVQLIDARIARARLFTVGIGSAPNGHFMREAATAGRGSFLFIAEAAQVAARMGDLFRKLEQPALVDLELRWPDGAAAELAADLPRDVYAGDPLVLAVRLPREPRGLLTLSGRTDDAAWVRQLPLRAVRGESGLDKLWARERIGALTRRRKLGGETAAQLESQIVELALRHHLVSDYTSLVAVDVTPVRPLSAPLVPEQAPTVAPAGSYWSRTTGFARTATPASLLLAIGAALLGAALLLWSPRGIAVRRLRRRVGREGG